MSDNATYLPPGQGTHYRVLGGDELTFKITGEKTNNEFTLVEVATPPDCGPPLHRHEREEETFYVLEGSYVFHVGDRRIMAGQGAVLVAPKNTPHRFVNVGTKPGRLLITLRPSGFENFIRDFATIPLDQPPDIEKLHAIGAKHGIVFL